MLLSSKEGKKANSLLCDQQESNEEARASLMLSQQFWWKWKLLRSPEEFFQPLKSLDVKLDSFPARVRERRIPVTQEAAEFVHSIDGDWHGGSESFPQFFFPFRTSIKVM